MNELQFNAFKEASLFTVDTLPELKVRLSNLSMQIEQSKKDAWLSALEHDIESLDSANNYLDELLDYYEVLYSKFAELSNQS